MRLQPFSFEPQLSHLCLKVISAAVSTSGLAVKGTACQLPPPFPCSLCLKWDLNVAGSVGKEKRAWFIYSTLASPVAEGLPRVTRLAVSGHCHRHKHLLWLIAQCCGPFSSGFARGCNTFVHSVCYESYRLQHLSEEMMLRHAPNQPVGRSTWDLPLSRRAHSLYAPLQQHGCWRVPRGGQNRTAGTQKEMWILLLAFACPDHYPSLCWYISAQLCTFPRAPWSHVPGGTPPLGHFAPRFPESAPAVSTGWRAVSPHFFQSCVTFFTVARSGTEQAPWHDGVRVLHGTVVTAQAINSYKNLFIWRIRLGYWERHQLSEIWQGSWISQLGPTLLSALSPTPSQPLGNGCGRAESWASYENRVPQGESTREKRQA